MIAAHRAETGMLDSQAAFARCVEDVTVQKLVSNGWLWWHDDGESERALLLLAIFTAVVHLLASKLIHTMISP